MSYLKRGKSIRGNVEGRQLHIAKEAEEILREQKDSGQRFMTQTFPQHHATVKGHFWGFIAAFKR